MNGQRTKKAGLSKSKLLAHRQCARRLWLANHRPELAEESTAAFAVGNEVGATARALYTGGILIVGDRLDEALAETRSLVVAQPTRPLFEATFEYDGVLVRADVLEPAHEGYKLIEVKSAASVKPHHVEDAAIQAWVLRGNGIQLHSVAVAHIDTAFVYPGGGNYAGLFAHEDVTVPVDSLQGDLPTWVDAARRTLEGDEPEIDTGEHCETPYTCPFVAHCTAQEGGEPVAFPVEDLPRGGKLITQLRAAGYADLRQLPPRLLASEVHRRVHRAVTAGQADIVPGAAREIERHGYPRYYMDFETLQSAVPRWAGTRPYVTQVPFQWSCHIESKDGELTHEAFLATGQDDPRRAFAESVLGCIGTVGPIFVYNAAFERARLRELAALFPDRAQSITAAVDRIVDLLPIARAHYYHPDQHGSWSIKAVLPTIAPELDYESLTVGDGMMAQDAFREMLAMETSDGRRTELRDGLLEYCALDTLALVRLVEYFTAGAGRA